MHLRHVSRREHRTIAIRLTAQDLATELSACDISCNVRSDSCN